MEKSGGSNGKDTISLEEVSRIAAGYKIRYGHTYTVVEKDVSCLCAGKRERKGWRNISEGSMK